MNDLNTICNENGTTQQEAVEAAKPYYYRLKTAPEAEAVDPVSVPSTSDPK